jgi:predicted Ser/Thr protein kinase
MDADSWRQAKSVLEAALLCEPAERNALIAARCADPSLRREVLACLDEHDESFLESALTITNTFEHATSADDVEAPPDVKIGERIGRYEVVGRLGAGGMGQVFLGKDTELDRQVALKCLLASASAVDVRSRILHEARAAARIKHDNIAVVHDFVEHDGRPFIVMEYVEGENLAQVLKRERPPLERILAIGRQLASALAAAHAKGIIHRDLKPANIQVTPDGPVKILDFGVAQARSIAEAEPAGAVTTASVPLSTTMATLRTERGAIRHPGTPAYMSPEQMFGKPIDGRSDIYSLGVILYEMSTGHRPYSTDDPLDVVLALSHKLLRPSGAETHLPEAVNDVIGKMLAVDLDQRYQTAAEVENVLTGLITPEPGAIASVRSIRQSRLKLAVKVAVVVIAVPVAISALGFLETAAFNYALGRTSPFDEERRLAWLGAGASALFLPLIYQVVLFFMLAAVRFVVRMLSLSRNIDRLLATGFTHTQQLSSRLGLNDPVVLSQAVAMFGLLAIVALVAEFREVVRAWMARIDTYPLELLAPLRPGNRTAYQIYHFLLSTLVFALTLAVVRIWRLRAAHGVRNGAGSYASVVGLLTFSIVMLVLPHRISQTPKFERVDVGSDQCFVLGEHDDRLQVHCPADPPPRNRIIQRDAEEVRRLGTSQNILTAPETSR